jgi:hypothetical protein
MFADIKKILDDGNVLLAMDSWNGHYQCFNPNNWPQDWMINDRRTIPTLLGRDWFDLKPGDVSKTDLEIMQSRQPNPAMTHLYQKGGFWHKLITNIPPGQQYLYPIQINRPGEILNDRATAGYRYVSDRVKQDVRQGIARIVLMMPYEGDFDFATLDAIHEWSVAAGFEKEHVYFINANILSEAYCQQRHLKFTPVVLPTIFVPMFPKYRTTPLNEAVQNFYFEECRYQPNTSTRELFLCYNRRPRWHRTLFLAEVVKNKLFHRGLISFRPDMLDLGTESLADLLAQGYPGLVEYGRILDHIGPMELDMDLEANNPAVDVQPDHYQQTFLSVVPETCWGEQQLFFSEKIWKTVRIGHPFMLISSPGMLAKFKEFGFKTFDQWWDESYDQEPDLHRRIKKIVKELKKLSQLSTQELKHLRQGMKSIVEHNQALINSMAMQAPEAMDIVGNAVNEIWEGIK